MLKLQKVNKYFPGVHALKDINFEINKGEIVGLVGENGAGKSTLMKIIYGSHRHDNGEFLINGKPVNFKNPRQAVDSGIGMVFQEQSLIPNLKVMENIFLGFEKQFVNYGLINWKSMAKSAKSHLAKVKLDIDPYIQTSRLSFAQKQLVELAKVLSIEERTEGDLVILLDEPTSVLSRNEVDLLFSLVRELHTRASFVFVSHRLDEVIELSDRIYVMKDGEVVDNVQGNQANTETIQRKMVGRDIHEEYYQEQRQKQYSQEIILDLKNISLKDNYKNISLALHRGEVLSLVGTEGSGSVAILRSLFGLQPFDSGEIYIKGSLKKRINTFDAVKSGMGYIPRERKVEGIVEGMNIYENMTLSQFNNYSTLGILKPSLEKQTAKYWIEKLSIKTASLLSSLKHLSGGNQQKVVLSKWRSGKSDIILLDHPTRGLDIGAKEDVYNMVRNMSEEGCGILLVADTLEEAIGLSHTITILKDGEIKKTYSCEVGNKPSLFDLIHYMV